MRTAYAKVYSGYAAATFEAHDAATRSVAVAGLSDDEAIQAALVLNGAATDIIKAAVTQVQFSENLTELEEFESLAEDFEPIVDGLLETIVAVACK